MGKNVATAFIDFLTGSRSPMPVPDGVYCSVPFLQRVEGEPYLFALLMRMLPPGESAADPVIACVAAPVSDPESLYAFELSREPAQAADFSADEPVADVPITDYPAAYKRLLERVDAFAACAAPEDVPDALRKQFQAEFCAFVGKPHRKYYYLYGYAFFRWIYEGSVDPLPPSQDGCPESHGA